MQNIRHLTITIEVIFDDLGLDHAANIGVYGGSEAAKAIKQRFPNVHAAKSAFDDNGVFSRIE